MFDFFLQDVGKPVQSFVLMFANLLKDEGTPGLFACFLVLLAIVAAIGCGWRIHRQCHRLTVLRKELEVTTDEDLIGRTLNLSASRNTDPLRTAWDSYRKTLIIDDRNNEIIIRSTVRSVTFFNLEELGYGINGYRILPGIFVSIGLCLTFLGLIAALNAMGAENFGTESMTSFIGIASAKFIMSLTGLICSILLTLLFHKLATKIAAKIEMLTHYIEERFTFTSLEEISLAQLKSHIEAQKIQRELGFELVAELGKPLREEVPRAISTAISEAIKPILGDVSRQGTEGIDQLVRGLSEQVAGGVEHALTLASERIAQAGDRIAELSRHMDESSGKMGAEMDRTIVRMAEAVEGLQAAMKQSAKTTQDVFSEGASSLLTTMNSTLQGIRENTAAGAKAMSEAASDMKTAATAMRTEMEAAAKEGADAARLKMEAASDAANRALDAAGQTVLSSFETASSRIGALSNQLVDKAQNDLFAPITTATDKLEALSRVLHEGTVSGQTMADSLRDGALAGAHAAEQFRSSSVDFVSATQPVKNAAQHIETSVHSLAESTKAVSTTVMKSADEVARAAAQTLETAQKTLGAQQQAIKSALDGVDELVRRMQGQGDRLDDIDQKLGSAFEIYATKTQEAIQAIRSNVVDMSEGMNTALDTLRTVVDQLQDFRPQQGRS